MLKRKINRSRTAPQSQIKSDQEKVWDVIIVGAGQCGLAAGYYLKQTGLDFTIVDRGHRVGNVWRQRYDSLVLFTPRFLNGLPGMPMPGDSEGRPCRDEFADFLDAYAESEGLPIQLGVRVDKIRREEDGVFVLTVSPQCVMKARSVILAYGTYPGAGIPPMRKDLSPKVLQLTASNYKNPSQIKEGPVLVVGDGASGRDFAAELAPHREVILATGRVPMFLPERILGTSIWRWAQWFGLFKPKKAQRGLRQPLPDTVKQNGDLKAAGVKIKPRLVSANGTTVTFDDGTTANIKTVIWALGYFVENSWIEIPEAKAENGHVLHDRGISPVPGLYFVGRRFQAGLASGLITGAGQDADHVVKDLEARFLSFPIG